MSTFRLFNVFVLLGLASTAVFAETSLPTATAKMEKVQYEQMLDGVVEAVKQSTVAAQISGRITDIRFDVDDVVEKDTVLLRIHDKEYKARMKQAKAALAQAKAQQKDAAAEFKRISELLKERVVSEAQYDKADAALKSAEAQIEAAEGQLAEVEEQFRNTSIRAPYAGIVVKRHVELGETVNVGQKVMTGFSLDQLRVNVKVPQSYINAVRKFKTANVYDTDSDKSLATRKITIFPYADAETHSFKVRVDLVEGIKGIYPGMLVKTGFVIDERETLMVPTAAVVHRVEVEAVYVVDATGKISMRQIRAGREHNGKTEILAGLDAGEKVALDPLRAGSMLKERKGAAQ